MSSILGVDLGTTNTSAALVVSGREPIPIPLGGTRDPYIMRSAALKFPDGRWLAGDAALAYVDQHPDMAGRLLTAFKPLLMQPERGQTRWQAEELPGELMDDPLEDTTMRVGGGVRYVLRTESLTSALCPPGFTLADVRQATGMPMTR